MNERISDSDYQQLHHFISESAWDHEPVLARVGKEMSDLFASRSDLVGLIFDESGHRKSGKKSVGVCRQYLGSIGKVDNGQVAVFAALSQGDDVGMVDARLYLPKVWTENAKRCKKGGVPLVHQKHKSKPVLALEMAQKMQGLVKYDWVGGDTIYGNSAQLRQGLQDLEQLFVMDIAEDFHVYLQDPAPYVPSSKEGRGRSKSRYVSDSQPLKAMAVKSQLAVTQWKTYTVRNGTKGPLIRKVAVVKVFVWTTKMTKRSKVEKLRLIISCNKDGAEIKYSLTNDVGLKNRQNVSEWGALYRQMQRYWVERGIQDCKDTIGMTDYQVRRWRAWHHHIALTIMALHFMVEQKVINEEHIPLLSCPDIKFFLAMNLPKKASGKQQAWSLILKRHEQRQNDLNRYLI